MNNKSINFLSLFFSSSTLICCALPSLFVAIGAGASLASLVTVFPFLIVLSELKIYITFFALIMLSIGGYANYKTYFMPCPVDPKLAKTCMQKRKRLRFVYYFSVAIFISATFLTYFH